MNSTKFFSYMNHNKMTSKSQSSNLPFGGRFLSYCPAPSAMLQDKIPAFPAI